MAGLRHYLDSFPHGCFWSVRGGGHGHWIYPPDPPEMATSSAGHPLFAIANDIILWYFCALAKWLFVSVPRAYATQKHIHNYRFWRAAKAIIKLGRRTPITMDCMLPACALHALSAYICTNELCAHSLAYEFLFSGTFATNINAIDYFGGQMKQNKTEMNGNVKNENKMSSIHNLQRLNLSSCNLKDRLFINVRRRASAHSEEACWQVTHTHRHKKATHCFSLEITIVTACDGSVFFSWLHQYCYSLIRTDDWCCLLQYLLSFCFFFFFVWICMLATSYFFSTWWGIPGVAVFRMPQTELIAGTSNESSAQCTLHSRTVVVGTKSCHIATTTTSTLYTLKRFADTAIDYGCW